MNTRSLPVFVLIAALSPIAFAVEPAKPPKADDQIVIYRCTDGEGRLTLRDSPCRHGERQDIRTMTRPKDASTAVVTHGTRPATQAVNGPPSPQVLVIHTPRPLYECAASDDTSGQSRYLSESPEGKLRWVQAPDRPTLTHLPVFDPNAGFVQVSDTHRAHPLVYDNGAWVRDRCYALPPADACARLREERGNLGRRRFNAQQSEREQIHREERSVEARLAQDCR
jgi:hypothetical protein